MTPAVLIPLLVLLPVLSVGAKPHAPPIPPPDLPSLLLRQQQQTPTCGGTCRFRLCTSNGTGPPTVLPPSSFALFNEFGTTSDVFVCLPSEPNLGLIRVYSRPFVRTGPNRLTPIVNWSPPGLDTPFGPSSVRLRNVPGTPWSGLSAGRPSGNQWRFLNRQCMVVLIRVFEVLNPAEGRVNIRVVPRRPTNCVAFRTLAPYLQVRARWDSEDDLDLEVNEPGRDIVDWVTPQSGAGRLDRDGNSDACGSGVDGGSENVLYDFNPDVQRGQYTVRLNHFQRCGGGATRWNVTVVQGGVRGRVFSGTSSDSTGIAPAFGRTVLDATFEF